MRIKIAEIHFKDPKIEDYAIKKVEKLAKFNNWVQSATIRLTSEKAHRGQENDFFCELEFDIAGKNFVVKDHERAIDMAIDKAAERAKRILVRHKEKIISKKHKAGIKIKNLKKASI